MTVMTRRMCFSSKQVFLLILFVFCCWSTSTFAEQDHEGEELDEEWDGSGDEEDEEYYFYAPIPDSPVTEFPLEVDGEVWDNHEFLYDPDPEVHRIVEFYAHWCPHCLHMKEQYINFASRLKKLAASHNIKVEVYAISCVPHRPICHYYGVHRYPNIKFFEAGETNSTQIEHSELHPFQFLRRMGLDVEMDLDEEPDDVSSTTEGEISTKRSEGQEHEEHFLPRTKKEIYNDAYLSFHFAMKNGIFTGPGSLTNATREHFFNFLELAQATLPPAFRLHNLVSDLIQNIDEISKSEESLLAIVDQHPPKKKTWSHSCTRGDPAMGYTCGLWELFHIISVGLVEWNDFVTVDDYYYYRPDESADMLRHFIENFFGCEVCRKHFIEAFEACEYNRCKRLISHVGEVEDWIEFPMWLYEFHNGVNVRLMKEKAERERRTPTVRDEISVQWPSRKDCPICWQEDGSWNSKYVYMFLRLTYWPEDDLSKNMRRRLREHQLKREALAGRRATLKALVGCAVFFACLVTIIWLKRRRKIPQINHSKKTP